MVSEKSEMSPKLKITVKYGGKETESKDTPMQQRRSSARIQAKQKEVEEIKLRRIAEVVEEKEKSGEVVTAKSNKRKKINDEESVVKEEVVSEQQKKKKKSHCEESLVKEEDVSEQQKKKKTNGEESVVKEEVVSEQQKKKKKSPATARRELMEVRNEEITVGSENAVGALGDKSLTAKVKDTIRVFNKHYLHLIKVSFFSVLGFSTVDIVVFLCFPLVE